MAGEKTVALKVSPEMHAAWTKAAKKAGVPLTAYIRVAVEELRERGDVAVSESRQRGERRASSTVRTASVRPQDCTARVPAGSWCRKCESIHAKGPGR